MKKMKLLLIIGGVLVTGIVAVMQYFEEEKNEKERKENETLLNTKINQLTINNSKLSDQLTNLQLENSQLSQQLTNTSLKLNESVLGLGDLDFILALSNDQEFRFKFMNNGTLPVYDAYITITNCDELAKCGTVSQNENEVFFNQTCRVAAVFQEPPLTINSHGAIIVNNTYKLDASMNFLINIISRKKSIMIQYAARIINGNHEVCTRTFEVINNQPVFKKESFAYDLPKDYWKQHFFDTKKFMYLKN